MQHNETFNIYSMRESVIQSYPLCCAALCYVLTWHGTMVLEAMQQHDTDLTWPDLTWHDMTWHYMIRTGMIYDRQYHVTCLISLVLHRILGILGCSMTWHAICIYIYIYGMVYLCGDWQSHSKSLLIQSLIQHDASHDKLMKTRNARTLPTCIAVLQTGFASSVVA